MKNKNLLAIVVLVIIVGVGSFFAGIQYQKSKGPLMGDFQTMREQFRTGDHSQGLGGPMQGQGRPVSGEIIDSDEESITVKLPDDSTRIIFVGDSTEINKSASGTKDDLTQGTQVMVFGSENPDGSISAANIQLDPQFREDAGRMHEAETVE